MPRATAHIPEIQNLIAALLEKGLAYRAPDGSVYFSIQRYRESGRVYGQLVRLNFEALRAGERVQSDNIREGSIADFACGRPACRTTATCSGRVPGVKGARAGTSSAAR